MKILSTAVGAIRSEVNLVGAPSFAEVNPYGLYNHFKADEYASSYPNVRPITNELMGIIPHAIDGNGKPVAHPSLDALFHPNKTDSLPMFMEKLGVSVLALPYTYLLVWRKEGGVAKPGGNFGFKGKNIGGYTFLERPAVSYADGKIFYKIGSQTFTEDEVIAIPGGSRPDSLYEGYSPAMSACRWATLDGYIGDYQNGFFKNGAIPSGMFRIAAATNQDFKDMKAKLEERHQGAGNNNNVSYSHVPLDSTGKAQQAQLEWVPFTQSNKDIDFEPLLKHVDNRLSESYGVSSIIKGVDSNAKYSNAEVSEAGFAKRAVKPLALRIYSQITHELNRITGGLGVSLTFKYDIPAVSDAEKVKAETKQIEGDIIIKYTSEPYNWSLESVVEAFQLSNSYKLLRQGTQPVVIDNDKPEVDEGNEVSTAPERREIDGVTPISNLKSELTDQEKMEKVARDFMAKQVDRSISELSDEIVDQAELTEGELDEFAEAMMKIISAILIAKGASEYAAALTLAGLTSDDVQGFLLPESAQDTYRAYLRRVGQSYSNDTANAIRTVLADANDQGLNLVETKARLKDLLNTDDYRVKRLARTELNNSQNIGKLEGVKSLAAEVGGNWEKTIQHTKANICPLCQSQEGIWSKIDQPLWGLGESIVTQEKDKQVVYINDWQSNEANDYHPNGTGSLVFRRVL